MSSLSSIKVGLIRDEKAIGTSWSQNPLEGSKWLEAGRYLRVRATRDFWTLVMLVPCHGKNLADDIHADCRLTGRYGRMNWKERGGSTWSFVWCGCCSRTKTFSTEGWLNVQNDLQFLRPGSGNIYPNKRWFSSISARSFSRKLSRGDEAAWTALCTICCEATALLLSWPIHTSWLIVSAVQVLRLGGWGWLALAGCLFYSPFVRGFH